MLDILIATMLAYGIDTIYKKKDSQEKMDYLMRGIRFPFPFFSLSEIIFSSLIKPLTASDQHNAKIIEMELQSHHPKIETSCVDFRNFVNYIKNQDIAGVSEEINEMASLYTSSKDLISDFNNFIDSSELSKEEKNSCKEFMKSLRHLLEVEFDKKELDLNNLIEITLKENNLTAQELDARNKTLCDNLTRDLEDDYKEVLKKCQSMYIDASLELQSGSSQFATKINECINIQANTDSSDILVSLIAIWAKNNINLPCLNDKTQEELTNDIMNYINEDQKANV